MSLLLTSLVITLLLAPMASAVAVPAPTADHAIAQAPTDSEVASAVRRLKADPNIATERRVRALRWVEEEEQAPEHTPDWVSWMRDLFGWIAEAARTLVWITCALAAGLLSLYLLRVVRARLEREQAAGGRAPTHVRDLDIRPESLPHDIGAAAQDLWSRGERRAALALLYRGCLSRLAHFHGVPIAHSTTEGECIRLAARHLSAERASYVEQLIRTWQRAVYGGVEPAADAVARLCGGFAAALDAPQASEGPAPEGVPATP
jgi:hypothetical protein